MAQTTGGPASAGSLRGRAPVAQLDRADGFYPSGCAFESCRGRISPGHQRSSYPRRGVLGALPKLGEAEQGKAGPRSGP